MTALALTGLLAAAAGGVAAAQGLAGVEIAQLIIRQRVVVRVQSAPVAPPRIEWREGKGPRCVDTDSILGAAIVAPGSVDIIQRGGKRIRARFAASCPGLDYYSGFYVAPTKDRRICADRDAVRDRAGGECEIVRFRGLSPRH